MNTPFSTFLKGLFFLLIFLIGNSSLEGQTRVYRQFSTQAVDKQFLSSDESVVERRQAIERYVKNYQHSGALPNFTIPIIFHHVYKDNPISPSVIENSLATLNTAFQYRHDWKHPAHDILEIDKLTPPSGGIQFCLADVDLMGDGSIGYNYIQVEVAEWTIDGLVTTALGANATGGFDFTAYKPENYLNVWIVDLPDNEAGYAQLPWSPIKSDGIVINRNLFESSDVRFAAYAQQKSLVHLAGSYLGLLELWSDDKPCTDDRIFDTPLHNAPNYGSNSEYRHISLCDGKTEHTMNYMDATDDNFMYTFSLGQMLRVAAMLSEGGPRGSLKDVESLCNNLGLTTAASARNKANLTTSNTVSNFQISPNPAKDQVLITYRANDAFQSFQLFNANGQLLQTFNVADNGGNSFIRIDCSTYPSGIYFMTAHLSSGKNQTEKQTQRFTLSR